MSAVKNLGADILLSTVSTVCAARQAAQAAFAIEVATAPMHDATHVRALRRIPCMARSHLRVDIHARRV